jgi:hypothetical protein
MMTEPNAMKGLRSLYDRSLGPYLTTQDAEVSATLRNRWLVLVVGLALAGGILTWAVRSGRIENGEFWPAVAFGLAVVSAGYFLISKDALAHVVRDHVMAEIAPLLGLRFESHPKGLDAERFEILGLARCSSVIFNDRLSGKIGGLAVDLMTAKLTNTTTTGAGSNARTHTTVKFTGVLMRLDDPSPPAARFRLIPPAARSRDGMLRGETITIHGAGPQSSRAEIQALLAATPEEAPITPTGDAVFDARFELHASAPDVAAALARLDAGTRAALLEIADMFGGGPVSVGFDAGGILLAFVTKQRFEIGRLKPPMAQFERVEHLAEQMGIVSTIAERLNAKPLPV